MIKLGIDIVDLHDPQFRERGERALKLISNEEDEILDHPLLYWLLWAAKEAVFKCNREALNFTPTQIPVQLKQEDDHVFFKSNTLEGHILINEENITAICSNNLSRISYQIRRSKEPSNSGQTRQAIQKFFSKMNVKVTVDADELNLPIIQPFNEPISISHHGYWYAFAYPKKLID